MLIDPEPYDASEQQFAASLEAPAQSHPRFVIDEGSGLASTAAAGTETGEIPREPVSGEAERVAPGLEVPVTATLETGPLTREQPDSWRQEVAARVNTYRARRRPREPRYPSLRLKFDPPESTLCVRESPVPVAAVQPVAVVGDFLPQATVPQMEAAAPSLQPAILPEPAPAKIIEFPRSAAAPPRFLEELADPVLDRPRILEAPEIVHPPPALGGILIEPAETSVNEKRPGFEIPLQAAAMSRRVLAAMTDGMLVLSAFASFAYIFFRIAGIPPRPQALGASLVLMALFWATYQYLLLVCAGTTPGLKLAKLQLSRFDGTPVPRAMRRWRVLLSVLSGASLGLGYVWYFFDEDELCWHDRITRTYMAPTRAKPTRK